MFETPIHWVRDIAPHWLGLMARPRGGDALHARALYTRALYTRALHTRALHTR